MIKQGDALELAAQLEPRSVNCIMTSPPYFGMRDYNLPPTDWPALEYVPMAGLPPVAVAAWSGCLGNEPTLEMYVAHLVAIFDRLRNALRDDGVAWLNLGDSYATNPGNGRGGEKVDGGKPHRTGSDKSNIGLPQKNLIGVPWRVSFALQAAGWYLRNDVIWHKTNGIPSSATDRLTSTHEYIFLLTKLSRYWFDQETIKVPAAAAKLTRMQPNKSQTFRRENSQRGQVLQPGNTATHRPDREEKYYTDEMVNRRDVWSVSTKSFKGAHFACVDEETECLTIEGWKKYSEIKKGDLAAQFDIETRLMSWGAIQEIAFYQVDNQNMVVAQNRSCKMVLTPNHRTIISRRHPRTRKHQPLTIIEADQLKTSHSIPISAEWETDTNAIEPITADWAELLGWYIAEGCETAYSWTVEITQSHSANPEKVRRIRFLLNKVGAEHTEARTTRQWRNKEVINGAFQIRGFAATYLRQLAPSKQLPNDVLEWSPRLLKRLLDGLVDGDGHRRKDGRFCYIQRSKQNSDLVQAIGVRLGYATILSWRSEGTYTIYFTQKRLLSFRGTSGEGARIEQENYTGIVWCPRLPKGTWIARKNGRAFVTGNTFNPELITPCVLAGCPPRVCAECDQPWRREIIKVEHETKGGDLVAACCCGGDTRPGLVLDPFIGSGTTAKVAIAHNRHWLGFELNPEYIELVNQRLHGTQRRLVTL